MESEVMHLILFLSYLNDRKQYTVIENNKSHNVEDDDLFIDSILIDKLFPLLLLIPLFIDGMSSDNID